MKISRRLSWFSLSLALSLGACSSGNETPDANMGAADLGPNREDGAAMNRCIPAGATPQLLVRKTDLAPERLAVDGATLYFGSVTLSPTSATGSIYRIPTSGGTPEIFVEKDFLGGAIGFTADSIVFTKGVAKMMGPGLTISYPNVLVMNKHDKRLTTLDNPPRHDFVDSLLARLDGVYWGSRETGSRTLSRWDPVKKTATELTTLSNYSPLVADAANLYSGRIIGSEVVFESIALTGGPPKELKRLPYVTADLATILGVSEGRLYFSAEPAGGVVETMSTTGGPSTPLTTIMGGVLPYSFLIDDTHIYWTDQQNQERLMRMRKSGGTAELIASAPGQYVQFFTADACNIYWSVVNPPAIFVRSR